MKSVQEYKRIGRNTLRKHYFLLFVICLMAMAFQMEFGYLSGLVTKVRPGKTDKRDIAVNMTLPWVQDQVTDLIWMIKKGYFSCGKRVKFEDSFPSSNTWVIQNPSSSSMNSATDQRIHFRRERFEAEMRSSEPGRQIYGWMRLLAFEVINKVFSMHILVQLAESIRAIVTSTEFIPKMAIFFSLLIYLHIWTFFINVYRAMMVRLVLEANVYERVPHHRALHFFQVGKMKKASITMLYVYFLKTLWDLTIIGGFVKFFSYYAVPYIVAENPDIGAKEAVRISKQLMHGHKWECFLYHVSFIGWYLLSFLTFGLSDLFYFCPYRVATFGAYYADLRRGKQYLFPLKDKYLYAIASADKLKAAYPEIDPSKPPAPYAFPFKRVQRVILDWFGIWVGHTKQKRAYQNDLDMRVQYEQDLACREGKAYPMRLNPEYQPKWRTIAKRFSYRRCYTLQSLLLLFLFFIIFGWAWEVIVHLVQTGEYVNRGILHGPWLPIYGLGGVIILTFLHKLQKHWAVLFLSAVVLSGTLEYTASYMLERIYHMRWWDYTGYFMNLNGRICLEGLLVFGLGSVLVMYLFGPLLDRFVSKLPSKPSLAVGVLLLMIFTGDVIYSQKHPNVGKGITKVRRSDGSFVHPTAGQDEKQDPATK